MKPSRQKWTGYLPFDSAPRPSFVVRLRLSPQLGRIFFKKQTSSQLDAQFVIAICENIFIANIVKCRPPENRDPTPEESAACLPWLRAQFVLLRPRIVVCLGRIAAQQLISRDFSVTKDHGKFFDKQGTLFMATLHPAALLRNPGSKPSAFGDFVALRDKINEVCDHTYPK